MGNDVPVINDTKEQKECCKNQDNGMSFLSIVESAGKSVAGAVQKAENFGAGIAAGAAASLGLGISRETAEAVGKGAVIAGVGGAAALAATEAIRHPAAAAAIGAGAIGGALAAEVVKENAREAGKVAGKATAWAAEHAEEIQKVARDAGKGALIGGAVGLASGDATRAVTLAALGAVTGAAARCAEEVCKPCCNVKPGNVIDYMKDIGKSILDHVRNRPIEATAEAVAAGATGVVGGAMIHKMIENRNCEKLCEKVMKTTCCEIQKQAEIAKRVIVDPGDAIKAAAKVAAGATTVGLGIEAGKAAAEAIKQSSKELEQHRQENPTTSRIERGIGWATGGIIGGKAVGTAIELGDIKARKAYQTIKGWFE
jgi:hypothetical protein